jgi:hypothetical protein
MLTERATRYRLRSAGQEDQAERELAAFWDARGWSLTDDERGYLDAVAQLVASGAVTYSGRGQVDRPFAPIYRVSSGAVQITGRTLRQGTLFTYNFTPGASGLAADLPAEAGVPDRP